MPAPSVETNATRREVLACLPLFAGLSPEEVDRLAAGCHILTQPARTVLFSQGEEARGMFVVLAGSIKVVRWNAEGREQVLHLVRSGNILAEAAVFQGGSFPASAVAVTAVRLLFIDRTVLTSLVTGNPELALRMLAALALRLRMLTHKLGRSRHGDNAARRVAEWLVHRQGLTGSARIEPGISRELLANLLGLARETLSRTLAGLERDGLLRLEGKAIILLDEKQLKIVAAL